MASNTAFNFGGGSGFNFPTSTTTSTGSGFSFTGPTPTTAGSAGSGNFSFVTPATSQAPSAAPAPFSFSSTPAATTSAATLGGFSFTNPAGSTSGGSLLSAAPQTAAPASTFSFSAPAAAVAAAAAPLSSFSFQNKPVGVTAPEPAKLPPATTLQSTLTFPTKPATGGTQGFLSTPVATTTSATAPAAAHTGLASLFPAQTQAATAPTTTTAAATLGLPTTSLSTAAPAATPALVTLTTATSTSSGCVVGVPGGGGTLSVAGLEEKVNKWVSEMREQEERLLRQAAHVNAWDQLLQQGHDQVQALRHTLNKVKTDQTRLEAELDFIQGQQQELEQVIEPLEAAAAATTPAQHQGDRQRENMHLLAQNLDSQLRQMTDDLCKVIEHLNSNNTGSQATDPVNTVARVLSAHMDTLKWVDQNVALLNQKVDDLSKVTESKRV